MKQGKLLELFGTLTHLGSQETPLRLTITRNLKALEEAHRAFQEEKQAKFEELVQVDEKGFHVLTDDAKKALEEGKINAGMLPFGAYVFQTEEGPREMASFIEELKEKEVEVTVVPVSMDKKILISEGETITLEEYLESSLSKIDARSLNTLLDAGVIS